MNMPRSCSTPEPEPGWAFQEQFFSDIQQTVGLQASTLGVPVQVHELRKEGDAERLVRSAFDAATLNPAEKTIHTFVAVGGDHTVNAGT